tara:strand:- start:80 stop:502 length:423 start_codon:yes stop_codon:yes gene_type:complete
MIRIFQIKLSSAEVDLINREGHMSSEKNIARMDLQVGKTLDASMHQYFTPSYDVNTDSLEQAFRLTNLWEDESKVTRLNGSSYSTSVGDLAYHFDTGLLYRCANFGWRVVDEKEADLFLFQMTPKTSSEHKLFSSLETSP